MPLIFGAEQNAQDVIMDDILFTHRGKLFVAKGLEPSCNAFQSGLSDLL